MDDDFLKAAIDEEDLIGVNKFLNRFGADIVNKLYFNRMPALMYAIKYVRGQRYRTFEGFFVKKRQTETEEIEDSCKEDCIVLRLIDAGCDVNVRGWFKQTPLIFAVSFRRSYEVVNRLISAGSDINAACLQGYTPLIHALYNKYNKYLIEYLIWLGADVRNRNYKGETALYFAVLHNQLESAMALHNAGGNAHKYTLNGRNLFCHINCHNCKEVNCNNKGLIDWLLNVGVSLETTDKAGNTLMHSTNCFYLIFCCIRYGISINVRNKKGMTPIIQAIADENVGKVNQLILFDAECSRVFWFAITRRSVPWYYSLLRSHEIVNILCYHSTDMIAWDSYNQTIIDLSKKLGQGYCNGVLSLIKHYILFIDENGFDHVSETGNSSFVKCYSGYVKNCKKELTLLKRTLITANVTYYQYCIKKRFYKSKFLNISDDKYKHNFKQIEKKFRVYHDIIIMRVQDNKSKMYKHRLLQNFENIIVRSLPINENDTGVLLINDCLYLICEFLIHKQLYNMFLASL